jgi:N-methylhydantoinase B
MRTDRVSFAPYGLSGGEPGGCSRNYIEVTGERRPLPGKITTSILQDTVIVHEQAGAGGFGDPLDRPPEAVLEDHLEGKITRDYAGRFHAVVLTTAGVIDRDATTSLRAARRARPVATAA